MPEPPQHIYVHFPKLDVFLEATDVAAAQQRVKSTFPAAAFSDWQRVGEASVMVAWADLGRKFRHLLGEESPLSEPDAFVVCQADCTAAAGRLAP
jgi:hypothetical protein